MKLILSTAGIGLRLIFFTWIANRPTRVTEKTIIHFPQLCICEFVSGIFVLFWFSFAFSWQLRKSSIFLWASAYPLCQVSVQIFCPYLIEFFVVVVLYLLICQFIWMQVLCQIYALLFHFLKNAFQDRKYLIMMKCNLLRFLLWVTPLVSCLRKRSLPRVVQNVPCVLFWKVYSFRFYI